MRPQSARLIQLLRSWTLAASWLPLTFFFNNRVGQIATLVTRYAVPAAWRPEFARAGGLIGYGASESDRVVGVYVGRILKGEKPADLPIQQTTNVELGINMNAAKALGVVVPQSILVRADEVIE